MWSSEEREMPISYVGFPRRRRLNKGASLRAVRHSDAPSLAVGNTRCHLKQAFFLTCFQSNCSYSRWLSVNSLAIWTPSYAQQVRLDPPPWHTVPTWCVPPQKINSSSCLCVKDREWSRPSVGKVVKTAIKDFTNPRRTIPCHAECARGVRKVSARFDPPEAPPFKTTLRPCSTAFSLRAVMRSLTSR